jgi:hypothetical protein
MYATVLSQGPTSPETSDDPNGHWVERQDNDTGEIVRVWVVEDSDPDTPGTQERIIPCIVRGVIDGGIRVAGTTERYTPAGIYESIDFAKMQFPSGIVLTKRDRITNVKNRAGEIVWKEEEFNNSATIFDVLGVTPILDPFGTHVENQALLQRAEVQTHG